jgi:ATP-binding cassette subfamily B protein
MKGSNSGKSEKQNRLAAAIWAIHLIWRTSRWIVAAMLVSTVLRGIVPAGFAIAIRGLINTVTEAVSQQELGWEGVVFWLGLSLAITLVDVTLVLAEKLFSDYLQNDLTLEVNSVVMRHASYVDLPYLENVENRELLDRVRQNPGLRLQKLFVQGLSSALSIIQVVSLLAVLAWLEPLIAVIAPIVAVPFMMFHWKLARVRYLTEYHRTRDRRWSRYFLSLVTSPDTIGEIKQLGIGDLLARRFINKIRAFREQDRKLQLQQFRGGAIFSTVTLIAFWVLFGRVVYRVLEGSRTIGDMAIFAGAVARLRSALQTSIRSAANAYEQTLYIADLREFIQTEPVVRDSEDAIPATLRGEISVEKVAFSYPGSTENVLQDVSLNIRAGEKVALVGENGSGKSTLAKLLVRLYDADSGTIRIDGRPIADYQVASLHSSIALLGQNFGRYEASMAENIALGDWERLSDDREAIERIATLTGLDHIARKAPEGLDTQLGRHFSEHNLSAGQWQLLAIARTLGRGASVVILDEPTSSIDARSEFVLFKAIEKMTLGLTTIIISHRFSTIRMMDRILVMHEGKIVEQGSHEELMSAEGQYRRLYSLHEHYRAPGF